MIPEFDFNLYKFQVQLDSTFWSDLNKTFLFSVLSKRALRQRDYSRAESCAKTSLWISVSALVLGGFFWVAVGAGILLKLKGYDFTYVLYS